MNPFERRKLVLFITCVLLAIVAWLFFALSNKYIYKVNTQAHYINYPQEKAFHSLQSDTVSLQVEGTGWQLLFARMRISPPNINVDLQGLDTTNYVTFSKQLGSINRQLRSSQRIVSVVPDTLYFDFSKRNVKKVPVKFRYKFQFRNQYGISGPIEVIPQYVMVSGPAQDLKNINYWFTDSVKRSDVYSDISLKPMLKKSLKDNISIYPNKVEVKVHIAEFTEKSFDIPVKVVNNTGYGVKLLPEKVKVTLLTALNNFPRITRESIEASVDVDNWQTKGYTQLPVKLPRFPPYCKLVRIEPQIVDFIIQ